VPPTTGNIYFMTGPHLLITPDELQSALSGAEPPLVIDARPAHEFAHGLIPTARHMDVWGMSLIDTSEAPLRAFSWMVGHLFALRGVSAERPVVVYEQQSGVRAARVFWLLEYLGHPGVRLLDGGWDRWIREGKPVSRDAQAPVPGTWHGAPIGARVATWQDVSSVLGDPQTAIVDTRSDDEYLGRIARARRAGAIPGAVHIEWTENLGADGCYKNVAALEALYAHAGITRERTVVTYCQGGYRAAHTYLALRLLGYPHIRNYTGSWKEWGDRDDLPIESPAPPV
jgi:thiosulfate/3-mercaptopyruvate sulfurtransferase